jgi:tetratricopeptide (TPR) repeat protein
VNWAAALALICILVVAPWTPALAQVGFGGQATLPEEFDAYLLTLKETKAEKIIAATSDFARRWPQSEMLAQILEMQAQAYASLGNARNAILSGEKALEVAPNNLIVLTNLAYTIANSASDPQQLVLAENYARRVLELVPGIIIPKKIPLQEWQETRSHLASTAHAALGLVAYKRRDSPSAIREFETAVSSEASPSPAHYYRLGLLYQAMGNRIKAIAMLQKAAQGSDPEIRQLAKQKLKIIPAISVK